MGYPASADWAVLAALRPRRKLPSLWTIAEYWSRRSVFDVILDWPHCFACYIDPPYHEEDTPKIRWNGASGYLIRAHLVNRALNGLDGPQNVVPLCYECHSGMPMFRGYDEYPDAAEWVRRGAVWYELRHPGAKRIMTARPGPRSSTFSRNQPVTVFRVGWPALADL
jgi:hypothetical protein